MRPHRPARGEAAQAFGCVEPGRALSAFKYDCYKYLAVPSWRFKFSGLPRGAAAAHVFHFRKI